MFRKFATILGTLGIFVGGFVLITVMQLARPKIEPGETVEVAPAVFYVVAKAKPVTLDVKAQGEVRPRTDINLTAQVAGRVTVVADAFVDGGAFKKDDILLQIEDADFRAASAGARARMAQAEEALRREEAEASLAARDYEELGIEGEASDLALRKPQLAQARANFDAMRAEYDAANLNLARTKVRAPFDGRVRERIAGLGQYVAPGAQLGRIFSTDVAEIRLLLNDNDLAKLGLPIAFTGTDDTPGPIVKLSAAIAGTRHEWEARLARTDGAIDPTTRQIAATAVLDDPYGKGAANGTPLAMGLFVDAVIEGKPYEGAFELPRSALHGQDEVYIIADGDVLQKRIVNVVSTEREMILVAGGLREGDLVVSSPLRGASAGSKVTPTDPASIGTEEDVEADNDSSASSATANAGDGQ